MTATKQAIELRDALQHVADELVMRGHKAAVRALIARGFRRYDKVTRNGRRGVSRYWSHNEGELVVYLCGCPPCVERIRESASAQQVAS